jgi:hypothetical protein
VEGPFEDPRKDSGPDPLAESGEGDDEPQYGSEREAEEDVLEDDERSAS